MCEKICRFCLGSFLRGRYFNFSQILSAGSAFKFFKTLVTLIYSLEPGFKVSDLLPKMYFAAKRCPLHKFQNLSRMSSENDDFYGVETFAEMLDRKYEKKSSRVYRTEKNKLNFSN